MDPRSTTDDGNESGSSSDSCWSVESITTNFSSSSSIQVNRGEQVELHELRLLRSVVRSIYYSADDEDDSDPEESSEAPVPEEGGLRPFIPHLLDSNQLHTVEEDEETDTSRETSPIPVSLVGTPCSSRHELDSSSAEDYDISGLWDDESADTVEQVKQNFFCIILFLKILSQSLFNLDFINVLHIRENLNLFSLLKFFFFKFVFP